MFRKSPSAGDNQLANRVRQMAERPSVLEQRAAEAPPVKIQSKTRPPRQPVYKNATLSLDDGRRMVVALKDVSPAGARIEYFNQMILPPEVTIAEPTLRLRRRARVVWQGGTCAGLEFI